MGAESEGPGAGEAGLLDVGAGAGAGGTHDVSAGGGIPSPVGWPHWVTVTVVVTAGAVMQRPIEQVSRCSVSAYVEVNNVP